MKKLSCSLLIAWGITGCTSNEWLETHTPINYETTAAQSTIEKPQVNTQTLETLFPVLSPHSDQIYSLPQLIDLSLSNNLELRIAWQEAKQSAQASDLVRASYYPTLTASLLSGYQKANFNFPYDIDVNNHFHEVIPTLALQWLLFDFGQRGDLLDAANHLTEVSHYNFNLLNQKIVHQITLTYLMYTDAIRQLELAEETLKNNKAIQTAVKRRREQGLATVVDVAQADQLVSQSELNTVLAKNSVTNQYQLLLQAMGLSPLTQLQIEVPEKRILPENVTPNIEQLIQWALMNRPDVLASYELLKVSESNLSAAEKSYLPKFYTVANLSHSSGYFGVQNFPDINSNVNASGIIFGVSLPIFDGGARKTNIDLAQSEIEKSKDRMQRIKNEAAHEIIIAKNEMNNALEAYQSAQNLVKTAQISYDAVYASYQQGLATITLVNEMAKNLAYAKTVENQSYTNAMVATSVLAFTLGYIENSQTLLQ